MLQDVFLAVEAGALVVLAVVVWRARGELRLSRSTISNLRQSVDHANKRRSQLEGQVSSSYDHAKAVELQLRGERADSQAKRRALEEQRNAVVVQRDNALSTLEDTDRKLREAHQLLAESERQVADRTQTLKSKEAGLRDYGKRLAELEAAVGAERGLADELYRGAGSKRGSERSRRRYQRARGIEPKATGRKAA